MDIYDEILTRLSSKVRIRSLFNDIPVRDIQRIIKHMYSVLEEKQKEKDEEKERLKAKKSVLMKIKQTLKDHDLDLADITLLESSLPAKAAKPPREKYTFSYKDLSGDTVFWYGSDVGRIPKPFQNYLDNTGKNRMDCVVESKAEQP